MKKKLFLPLLLAGMWATPALAAPYVGVSGGLGMVGNSDASAFGVTIKDMITYKSGFAWGAAVGTKVDDYRVEAALGQQTNKIDKVKTDGVNLVSVTGKNSLSALTYMLNGYRDFVIKDSGVAPYVTAGLGGASINVKSQGDSDTKKNVFAWQLGAGVGIKASDNVVFDLGYRYLKPSAFKVPDGDGGNLSITSSSSSLLAGVRYSF